jgi:hypothetical protein
VPGAGEVFGGQEGLLAVHSLHHRAQELIYMHTCLLHPNGVTVEFYSGEDSAGAVYNDVIEAIADRFY